jgi:hypothetical protein
LKHLGYRILLGIAMLYAGCAYSAEVEELKLGIEKEDLDVNLNPIYLSVRGRRGANVLGEFSVQLPFPVTKNAEETGLGPIAAIIYFDNKTSVRIQGDGASVSGLGRLYYVVSAHDTKHTFIPYLTFYRELLIDYKNTNFKAAATQSKAKAWLPPGFMYALRVNDKVVLHLDGELYSYKGTGNNTARVGASYVLADKWLVSASYERQSWDLKDEINQNISMNGNSNSIYLKLINSNPLRNNFAFTLGYAADRNTPGIGLLQNSINHSNGLFGGVEVTLGTLAW